MANLLSLGRALDINGYIAPGAKGTVYAAGTSTVITIFSDVAGTVPATNPMVADGNGFWPQRFVTQSAKVVITDADDAAIVTLDPAPIALGSGSAASEVSFSPTVPVPFTDVQSAIEGVAGSVLAGVTAYGIGITGNTVLLANLDATATASGVYRFDGTTTGTYPTGVAAADTGLVEYWRQTSTVAIQMLYHATTNRVFVRRMTASVWQSWREDINVNIGAATGDTIYRGASNWARLGIGTTGQFLTVSGGLPVWGGGLAFTPPVATTSGTTVTISTAIPSGVRRITVLYRGVSTDGTSDHRIQVGASGAFVTSGYTSQAWSSNSSNSTDTAGFLLSANASAGSNYTGEVRLTHVDSNIWVCAGNIGPNSAGLSVATGVVSLAGPLDRLRVGFNSGTSTAFDNGSVSLMWEF